MDDHMGKLARLVEGMAVTQFQGDILRLLANQRRLRGESDVAGGEALNALLAAPRKSRDIDLFHEGRIGGSWPHVIPLPS